MSMARAVRTVFELTGKESAGHDDRWIVATVIPIFRQNCPQTKWGHGTKSNIGGKIAGRQTKPVTRVGTVPNSTNLPKIDVIG